MTRIHGKGDMCVDFSDFPLVRLRTPGLSEYQRVNIPSFFDCADQALALNRPFAVLHDVRGIPHITAAQRQEFMRAYEARRARIEQLLVAYVALCTSPLERGLITAFTWLVQLPVPVRLVGQEAEARAWLSARLSAEPRRLPVPDAIPA